MKLVELFVYPLWLGHLFFLMLQDYSAAFHILGLLLGCKWQERLALDITGLRFLSCRPPMPMPKVFEVVVQIKL